MDMKYIHTPELHGMVNDIEPLIEPCVKISHGIVTAITAISMIASVPVAVMIAIKIVL